MAKSLVERVIRARCKIVIFCGRCISHFLVTLIIVLIFLIDPKVNTAPPEQVTYAEIYPANRTDAQIIADQKKDAAALAAAKKEKQRQFKELENQLGM